MWKILHNAHAQTRSQITKCRVGSIPVRCTMIGERSEPSYIYRRVNGPCDELCTYRVLLILRVYSPCRQRCVAFPLVIPIRVAKVGELAPPPAPLYLRPCTCLRFWNTFSWCSLWCLQLTSQLCHLSLLWLLLSLLLSSQLPCLLLKLSNLFFLQSQLLLKRGSGLLVLCYTGPVHLPFLQLLQA